MGGLSLEARRLLLIQLCLGALLSAGFALLGDLAQAGLQHSAASSQWVIHG